MEHVGMVLEDILNAIDVLLSDCSSKEDVSLLIDLVTRIFIGDNTCEVGDVSEKIKDIIEGISQLSTADTEKAYFYTVKKVNNPELEVACLLAYLPDDKTTAFTQKINKYLKKKTLLPEDNLLEFVENRNEDLMRRFKAYYLLFTYNHDQKNITKCKELVDGYKDEFRVFPLWYYTNSQIRYQEERDKDRADLSEALSSALRCIEIYKSDQKYDPNYPGIYHNFSELVFYASELGDKDSFEKNFEKATECIEEAKNINPKFAKYYYTQGRLLMAKSRYVTIEEAERLYDKAEKLFEKAIDLEDSSREGYAIKIVDYETALLRCKTERRLKDIDFALNEAKTHQKKNQEIQEKTESLVADSKTLKEELESQKRETLELLGFFSGIISLIVVTSQVVLNLDMLSAAVIMLLFLGTMIIAFSFFHFVVLNGERRKLRSVITYTVIGMLLIAGAITIACIRTFIP